MNARGDGAVSYILWVGHNHSLTKPAGPASIPAGPGGSGGTYSDDSAIAFGDSERGRAPITSAANANAATDVDAVRMKGDHTKGHRPRGPYGAQGTKQGQLLRCSPEAVR